jgi:hypothetical protein
VEKHITVDLALNTAAFTLSATATPLAAPAPGVAAANAKTYRKGTYDSRVTGKSGKGAAMIDWTFARSGLCALVIVATLLLAACNGSTAGRSLLPSDAQSSLAVSAKVAKGPLLYATDAGNNIVYIISLPGGKLVGKLTGFDQPQGDCADAKGDVFVTDTQAKEIVAYHHAAKEAYEVLNDPDFLPVGCAVNPVTGDLAVANCCSASTATQPTVAIYKHAKGSASGYIVTDFDQLGFCTYDGHGNLFVDGINSYESAVAELVAGKHKFQNITLNQSLGGQNISGIFWDGDYLAVGSQSAGAIYRFVIGGTKGTKVGTTRLNGGQWPGGFWIQTVDSVRSVYTPFWSSSSAGVGVYRYPKGGSPTKRLYAALHPFAVTVSLPAQ